MPSSTPRRPGGRDATWPAGEERLPPRRHALPEPRALTRMEEEDPARPRRAAAPLGADEPLDGRWKLRERRSRGGQGEVWEAEELGSGRQVAVKIGADASVRVIEEARAFARISHPFVVNVHAAGRLDDGREYVVMELVEGDPLATCVRVRGVVDVPALLERMWGVAGALTAIHGSGLVHGDVKPSNILVDRARDRLVLIDLGLGIRLDGPMVRIGGTPGLSAPEQFDPARPPITRAADVYGLATCIWKLVSGSGPWSHLGDPDAVLAAQRAGPPGRLNPDDASADFDAVLTRALSPAPAARPATPLAFLYELDQSAVGIRTFVARPQGVYTEAIAALLGGVEPREDLAPYTVLLALGHHYVSHHLWGEFLYRLTGGDLAALDRLVRDAVRRDARAQIRSSRLAFDPRVILESFAGSFSHFLPFHHLSVEPGAGCEADLSLDLPPPFEDALRTHVSAVVEEMIAHCGATATIAWRSSPDARWQAHVTWRTER